MKTSRRQPPATAFALLYGWADGWAPRAAVPFALALLALVLDLAAIAPRASAAPPAVDLHRLRWFVHVDMIDAAAGRDLAFWQATIDDAMARGSDLLEGRHGPVDRACCTRLARNVAVATFGSAGDGRDVLDTLAEQNLFDTTGPAGSNAYLIDSMTYCGGSSPGAIGCAKTPACDGNGNDNPNLWLVVTADAFDLGVLGAVVAHERGHNGCLVHATASACQLMQASVFVPGFPGCLLATECTNYRAARTTTASGLTCDCLSATSTPLADASLCARQPLGLCSGGLCDRTLASPAIELIAAATPGTAAGGPPDRALRLSPATGDWTTIAQFDPAADDVRGLEYADDSRLLFGIVPTVGDDRLVTVDPATGLITATVGTHPNGAGEFTALAYDPGATSAAGDDRLIVLEVGADSIGRLLAISPASPSSSTLLGSITWSPASAFTGLAYDSLHHKLFAATPFLANGLYEFDLAHSCPPSPCLSSQVPGAKALFREDASLSFSRATGLLYLVGTAYQGQRTFYDVIDPLTGVSLETRSLDTFTPAGLAVVPEPFSTNCWGPGVLGLIVAYRARHGRNLRERSDGRRSCSIEGSGG